MRKKTERQKIITDLDKLCREIILLRDEGKCQKCGKVGNQVSHVVPRNYYGLRWDLINLWLSCVGCHIYWWHKNILEAAEWFEAKWPVRWDYLQTTPRLRKWTVNELKELKAELKQNFKELK